MLACGYGENLTAFSFIGYILSSCSTDDDVRYRPYYYIVGSIYIQSTGNNERTVEMTEDFSTG
jgi:hypothetical protein